MEIFQMDVFFVYMDVWMYVWMIVCMYTRFPRLSASFRAFRFYYWRFYALIRIFGNRVPLVKVWIRMGE